MVSTGNTLRENIKKEQENLVELLSVSVENSFYAREAEMEQVVSNTKVQNILKTIDRKMCIRDRFIIAVVWFLRSMG